MIFGQVDLTQFKTPAGEWSIVAVLFSGFAIACSVVVFFYRKSEKEQSTRIDEQAAENKVLHAQYVSLQQKSEDCEKDRLVIHAKCSGLEREISWLKEHK